MPSVAPSIIFLFRYVILMESNSIINKYSLIRKGKRSKSLICDLKREAGKIG
jgi:hypothetical protein